MMGILDRLFKKNEGEPEKKVAPVVAEKPKESSFTGMRGKKTHNANHVCIYIDGLELGESRLRDNTGKSEKVLAEDIRQTILVLRAEKAMAKGDMDEFKKIKARAYHEKTLLGNPEFRELVTEAYRQAKATGYKYTDEQYQAAFDEVMKGAEDMAPNVSEKIANISERLSKVEPENNTPVAPEMENEGKTGAATETYMRSLGDSYSK